MDSISVTFEYNAELAELMNLKHPSNQVDMILDHMQFERGLARERANELPEETNHGTISYDKAMERELDYQKRMKRKLLQPPDCSRLPHSSSQELPPEPNLIGMKRKAASENILLMAPEGFHDRRLPTRQLQGFQAASQQLQHKQPSTSLSQGLHCKQPSALKPTLFGMKGKEAFENLPQTTPKGIHDRRPPPRQLQGSQAYLQQLHHKQPSAPRGQRPSLQYLQYQKPSPHLSQDRRLLPYGLKSPKHYLQQSHDRQPLPQLLPNQQPLPQQLHDQQPTIFCNSSKISSSQIQSATLRCGLCKLTCMNADNLKQHYQGKRHKANLEMACGNKFEIVWCKECNIPCMNEYSFAQHCIGKKHAAQLLKLQAINVARGDEVVKEAVGPDREQGMVATRRFNNFGSVR